MREFRPSMADTPLASDLEPRAARRAAAIAFLDVAGYSLLMDQGEVDTWQRWSHLRRQVIEPKVAACNGRVVDRAGDGLLLEFGNADDALRWAVEVQEATRPDAQDEAPMQLRIALHWDEVIDGGEGDIHGTGVNIAARLQAYADPGCVVLSQTLRQRLSEPLVALAELGPLQLRHISRPVHAFMLRTAPPARVPAAPRRQHRPSIAVLPFSSNDNDPEQRYFADGVTEGIVQVLTGVEDLFVISHASTLGFAGGAALDLRAAARELNVRYLLGGSQRRAGNRLRIATELREADSGLVLRSDRHEGEIADLFELQDEIALTVATTIAPQVKRHELHRALHKAPGTLTAYDLVLQALDQLHRLDQASFGRARQLLLQAMVEDAGYARAYSTIAYWHMLRIGQGWSTDPAVDIAEAARTAAAAIERDSGDALGLAIRGHVMAFLLKDFEAARELLGRALAAGPNCAMAWTMSSATSGYLGDGALAVTQAQRGLRLSPFDPFVFWHEHLLSQAYYISGDHDQAVTWARQCARHNPHFTSNLRILVAALLAQGRTAEACEMSQRMMQLDPSFRLSSYAARTPIQGRARDELVERLRQAGVPD